MTDKELKELLGIAPADFPVYTAAILVTLLYVLRLPVLEIPITVLSCVLMAISCRIGMKTDPELSGFTNAMKIWSYPIAFALMLVALMIYFAFFSVGFRAWIGL